MRKDFFIERRFDNRHGNFRGKRFDNGEWVYGYYYKHNPPLQAIGKSNQPDEHYIIKTGFADWNMPRPAVMSLIDIDTLGQFTDMKDKNNNKIYQGDILELINEVGEEIRCIAKFGSRKIGTSRGVIIDVKSFYFEVDGRKTNPLVNNYLGKHDLEIMRIVGNIYDNKELLEVE